MLEDDNSVLPRYLHQPLATIAFFFEQAHGQLLHTSPTVGGLLSRTPAPDFNMSQQNSTVIQSPDITTEKSLLPPEEGIRVNESGRTIQESETVCAKGTKGLG